MPGRDSLRTVLGTEKCNLALASLCSIRCDFGALLNALHKSVMLITYGIDRKRVIWRVANGWIAGIG